METIALLALAFLLGAGGLNKEEVEYVDSNIEETQELYNPSSTRTSDIIHTNLSVRFDWENQQEVSYTVLGTLLETLLRIQI